MARSEGAMGCAQGAHGGDSKMAPRNGQLTTAFIAPVDGSEEVAECAPRGYVEMRDPQNGYEARSQRATCMQIARSILVLHNVPICDGGFPP